MAKDRGLNLVKSHVIFKDYSKDAERTALVTGENLAHAFGKIARWYTDISWVGHTHNYAGSSEPGGAATSANKLNIGNADIGSETRPVYFNATTGKPVACAYSLNASVPANAVFTDTTYTFTTTGVSNGQIKVTPAGGTASTYTVYAHPSGTAKTQGLYKFAVDDYGHVTNASAVTGSDLPAHTHAYLPLEGGTMTGDIVFTGVTSTEYPAVSKQISFGGSTDGGQIFFEVQGSDVGALVIQSTDDPNAKIVFRNKVTSGGTRANEVTICDGVISGNGSGLTSLNASNISSGTIAAARLPDSYLPLSGGTISGSINYKSTTWDISAADNGVSSAQYPTTFNLFDKSDRIFVRTEGLIYSNGNVGWYAYVRNYNTSGTQVAQKGIQFQMNKSGNLTWSISDPDNFRSAISAAASNHTHSYLPLSGGTMTGVISSTVTTSTHIAGNKGTAIINSTASAGYNMLAKMKSSNGVFTMGTYNDKFSLYYTTDAIISAGTNTTTYDIILLNEAGNTQLGKNLFFPQKADGIYYTGTKATSRLVRFIDNTGDAYGNGIGIGGGGVVCIGSGEASDALIDASIFTAGSETLYLASDESIVLYSNCQTVGNRLGILYDLSGRLRPDTNNTRTIGGTDYYWNKAYITQTIGGYRGSWISARDNATLKNISVDSQSYTPVVSVKSKAGEWSIGTLGNADHLYFSYTTDTNYSAGTNNANTHYLMTDGAFSGSAAKWTTARTITIGSTGKSVDGSGNVSWSLSEIGAAAASHSHNYIGAISDGSYWGMGSPSLDGSAWIRTTSNGLIPYQSGGRTSSHSSLGTSSWYFSYAYVNSIYADLIGFNGTKATTQMIKFLDNTSDGNGNGILIGGGGVVCVGAGESASALNNASVFSPGTEQLYLAADGNINLLTNCDTVANRVLTTIDTAGRILAKNQVITSNADGFRICYGGIGSFMRNDGSSTYFLLTDKKTDGSEATAGWNSLRPIYWNNTTGWCTIYGGITRADYPTGFDSKSGSQTWGKQTGTFVTGWGATNSSTIAFRRDCPNSGQLSVIIDGRFYQNEGNYLCLDEENFVNYAARARYVDSFLSANRFAFAKAAGITVQYSRDGGSTLNTYTMTDANKIAIFTNDASGITIGNVSSEYATNQYQTFITVDANSVGVYSQIECFTIRISTNGSNGCKVYIEGMNVGSNTWNVLKGWTYISGWSGTNYIAISPITFGTGGGHCQKIRFTFGCDSGATSGNYHGMQILHIYGFGGEGWTVQGSLALTGHMYTWDVNKNVTFPAQLSCNVGTIGSIATRSAKTATSRTHSGYTNDDTDNGIAPTMGFIAYWNGAYNSSGNSNLAYCSKGAFGTIVTKGTGDYATSSHMHSKSLYSGSASITAGLEKTSLTMSSHFSAYDFVVIYIQYSSSPAVYGMLTVQGRNTTWLNGHVAFNPGGANSGATATYTSTDVVGVYYNASTSKLTFNTRYAMTVYSVKGYYF